MLKPLKPVSNLQRILRFDDYDLAANREGKLSPRQRVIYALSRLLEHFVGGLAVYSIAAVLIFRSGWRPERDTLVAITAAIIGVTFVLWLLSLRPALWGKPSVAEGKLSEYAIFASADLPFVAASIGTVGFLVSFEKLNVLEVGATYKAFYLPRPQRIGGNQLLSAELLTAAPPERYDETYE